MSILTLLTLLLALPGAIVNMHILIVLLHKQNHQENHNENNN
jgi:hypothetical protein